VEAEQIKLLKKGASDFYSWQLYRWLKETWPTFDRLINEHKTKREK